MSDEDDLPPLGRPCTSGLLPRRFQRSCAAEAAAPAMEDPGRCEAEAVPPEPNERQAARRRGGHDGEDNAYFDDCALGWCRARG